MAWPVMSLQAAHALMTAPGTAFEMEERTIRGQRLRVWKNAPPTLREVFVAGRAFGDKTYLVHEDERVSFETFARAALAIAAALRAFVRERIAAYKVPVRIVMMRETLPRNANGKIVKAALRPLFGDDA